ncbi:MAG: patatin [Frankiales bacterium]|nr:patatin [Frankiales bacterium]
MAYETAFVLGGGGILGACEVGMLKALLEKGIRPDVVLGTSIGALNGAFVAADPRPATAVRLEGLWRDMTAGDVFGGSVLRRAGTLAKTRTHLHPFGPMRQLLRSALPVARIEDLPVPFQCVAASIERAAEHWFTEGPLADAVLASCAVPGLLAPVRIGDEHFLDGGLVHSIPVGRAVALGAKTVYVLQVGRVEQPLKPPRRPWEVGMVAFEIARRHRYAADMAAVPAEVEVHVLPVGEEPPRYDSRAALKYRDMRAVGTRVDRAYEASLAYLDGMA